MSPEWAVTVLKLSFSPLEARGELGLESFEKASGVRSTLVALGSDLEV